jgi:LysM domain
MRASRLVPIALLVPFAALAQGAGPIQAAKRANAAEETATQARMKAADGASEEAEQPPVELGNAAAQLEGEPAPAPADGASTAAPTEGSPGAPAAGSAAPAVDSASGSYTVKPGDTLWDLSGRFLNNPWYWPKVWSYNPEIPNPHFIYPGSVVRLHPGGEEGPARVEPAQQASGEDLDAPRELDDFSRADMKKPQDFGEGDEVAVVGPYKIGYVPPKGIFARRDSFVTPRELQESGTIFASFEEKLLLSLHDRAYVRFAAKSKVSPGETYAIYKTERPVRHPVTGELFGYETTILGAAKVVAVDDKAVTVDISQAFDPIERGALVGLRMDRVVKQVARRPNQRQMNGYIIAAQQEVISEIGEHHVVFVDKGRADGVEEGNVFTVVRSGDPYGREMNEIMNDPDLPKEDVGTLVVVDAQQTSSAALVVRSFRELYVGDKVEMRSASAPSPKTGG